MPKLPATTLGFIKPMLPTLVEAPPEGHGWLHEIKHDGYRTQLVIEAGKVRACSRSGLDWTEQYPTITAAAPSFAVGPQSWTAR